MPFQVSWTDNDLRTKRKKATEKVWNDGLICVMIAIQSQLICESG